MKSRFMFMSLLFSHQSLGLSSASTGMFYNGAGDLVLHFISQCNSKLTEILAEQHNQVQLGQAEYVWTFSVDIRAKYLNVHRGEIKIWGQNDIYFLFCLEIIEKKDLRINLQLLTGVFFSIKCKKQAVKKVLKRNLANICRIIEHILVTM